MKSKLTKFSDLSLEQRAKLLKVLDRNRCRKYKVKTTFTKHELETNILKYLKYQ